MTNLFRKLKVPSNPYLLFSPFLILYILIVVLFHSNVLWGDENRYLMYAQNLIHGFYSPRDINLTNGPGYPLLLAPFLVLHLPLLILKLLNPIFYYLSIILLFKVLRRIVSFKIAFLFCLFWACYFNAFEYMQLMVTEIFTIFLLAALMFCLTEGFYSDTTKKSRKYIYLAGFLIGYIALTKIIFGYVIILMLIGSLLLWLIKGQSNDYKRGVIVLLIAFITTAPYLIYSYKLTGRIFYWTTVAGNGLYWMSSPYEDEYGNWFQDPSYGNDSINSVTTNSGGYVGGKLNFRNRNYYIIGLNDSLRARHRADYEEINKYTGPEQDDVFKKVAIKNIKSHPMKYVLNCLSNIGRILFNYPYSYKLQNPGTLLRLPFNGILAVLMIFCLIPTFINWRKISFSIRFILIFLFLYLGGSILASAETRMFTIIVPMLLLWIAYIMNKTVTIKTSFDESDVK